VRPLRLRVENLTAFRGEQPVLDLSAYELFAISGPTGSGKTSLLDAMLIALYGEVPRTAKNVKELISQGRDRMCVRLDFAVGGSAYRVTRAMYGDTRPTQAILERLLASGDSEPMADGVTSVQGHVERLVGLNYDAFTQAVILPQGQFDQFLHSKPKERNDILKELLRLQVYERMRERAETESKVAAASVEALTRALEQTYAGVSREALAGVARELSSARRANAALAKRLEKLSAEAAALRARVALVRELCVARRTLAELVSRQKTAEEGETRLELARLADRVVPLVDAAETARAEADQADKALRRVEDAAARAREAHRAAQKRLEAASKAAAAIPDLDARIEALGRAVALSGPVAAARRRADEVRSRAAAAQEESRRAVQASERARDEVPRAEREARTRDKDEKAARAALDAAQRALQEAQAAREEGLRASAIAHLRHGLRRGDACPVCERDLDKAPKPVPGSDLGRLGEAVAAAEAHVARAQKDHEAGRSRGEQARRAEERSRAAAEAAAERAQSAANALTQATADLEAALTEVAGLEKQLKQLSAEADPGKTQDALRQQKQKLSLELAAAQLGEAGAAAALAGAAAAVEAASARTGEAIAAASKEEKRAAKALADAEFPSEKAARQALLSDAEQRQLAKLLEEWKRESHAAEERVRTLEKSLAKEDLVPAALRTLEASLARADAELDEGRRERESGLQQQTRLEEQHATLEKQLAAAERARAELEQARARVAPLRQLSLDLRSNQFQAYLLEETFRELVAGASERLLKFSGRYGFHHEKNAFYVIDHDNASERRPAETLSGGETFLASLALALELSQQVQRAKGAVDIGSLFIDEGFGTLDGESLEVVADAIEGLPTSGRVVGIITHLPELTERLPACIQVLKGPDGSRIMTRG
jgi:exonuclease SbcC